MKKTSRNKIKKTSMALLTAAILCASTAVPVFAAEQSETAPHTYVCYDNNVEEIAPYMSYLSSMTSGIKPYSGKVSIVGEYTSFKTEKVELSVTLQYSTDGGSTWKNLQSWSQTYNPGNGSNILGKTYTNPPTGRLYRNKTVATVRDSSNKVLETAIVFSNEISY